MEGVGIAGELAHEQLRQLEPRPHGDRLASSRWSPGRGPRNRTGRRGRRIPAPPARRSWTPRRAGRSRSRPRRPRPRPGRRNGRPWGWGRAGGSLPYTRKASAAGSTATRRGPAVSLRPRNVFVFHEEERRDPAARGGDAGREQRRFHLDRPVRGGGPGREPSLRGFARRRRPARRRTGRGGLFRLGGLPGLGRDGRVVLHRRNRRFLRSSGHQVLVYEKYGDRESDRQDHPFFLSHRSLFPKIWIRLGSSMPPGWNGWHLRTRQIPSRPPTIAPLRRTDPIMYSEQLG